MFKTLNNDNTTTTLYVQGAYSHNSINDISGIIFQNKDADTQIIYNMAKISMRDQFGTSNQYGMGDLVFSTNFDGSSNLVDRMRINYDGSVCIGNNSSLGVLNVDCNLNSDA